MRHWTAPVFLLAATVARADPVEDFYRGRVVTVVITGSPGSIYDIFARTITRHMTKHIPGNPVMAPRSMIGGGHVVGTNYLYNVAPRDGSVLGSIGETMPLTQLLQPELTKFDAGKFNWLGNPNISNLTLVTWAASGARSLDDAKKREVIIGASGAASPSAQLPRLLNHTLGTRFKIVNGFPTNQLDLAMERGEIEGRGSAQWEWWKLTRPDWLRDRKINILLQIGPRKEADLPDAPLLGDLARDEAERHVFGAFSSTVLVGRPLLTTPGVPPDRLAALRKAFDATLADPEFLAEARQYNLPINPVHGEELQKAVEAVTGMPASIVAMAKAALGGDAAGRE